MELVHGMAGLGAESAFEVLAKARALEAQGKNIIHLQIGEPDFPTPKHIVEAGQKALGEGFTKYGPTQGLPDARAAIARYISRTRGIEVGPERVCIVPGAKPIMYFAIIALLGPGDEAIYANPGFPIYESMIKFQGAKAVAIPLVEERGFALDMDVLEASLTPRTKMIILNSPQNPTGGILPPADIERLAMMLKDRDIVVLSDEIYSRIVYEGGFPLSIATFPWMLDKTIILDGFSKTYSMTGWRLGYGVMNPQLVAATVQLMGNSNSCTATFTQMAGIAALEGPQDDVDMMVRKFKERRDAIVKGLNEIPGFRCTLPKGAFYAFPNVKDTGIPSKDLAHMLLYDAGVACLDGRGFGEYGEGFLRFSYANSLENIQEALRRIKALSARWAK
ncbi:MAG: pyridoxal phosphate-dependent aminotransferase [Acidobacteriota bacterium]